MVHSADTVYTIDELKFALEYAAFSRPDPRFKGSWHPEGMAEGTVKERIAELVDAAIDEEAFDKGPRRHPPHFDWGKEREPGEETETGANESGNATGKSDGASAKAKTEDIWDEEEPDEEEEPPEALTVGQLYGLLEEWEKQPWVWDGILPHSSLSLLTGKAETGKSTLLYALIFAVARGLPFLGRQCEQGSVLYLAGDPASEIVAGRTFRGLGISPQEPIMVLPGALAASPNGIRILRQTVEKLKPILIIGDTLASVVVLDVDKYGQSQGAQQPLVKVARKWKPNFLVSHHSQKSAVDSYGVVDSALGSVGVAAVASTRMATKKRRKLGADYYTFEMSNLRIGTPIQGEWIVRKMDNCLLELDGLWAAKQVECDRETILKELRERSEPVTKSLLWREMRIRPKYGEFAETLRMLVKEGWVLERPSGKTGGGSVYSMNQGGRQSNDL